MIKQLISLVKIAKQKVDLKEKSLQACAFEIRAKFDYIDSLNAELQNATVPQSGSFKDFQSQKVYMQGFIYEIDLTYEAISLLKLKKKEIQEELRVLNIEYEKLKYIYDKESLRLRKEKVSLEAKSLDSISNLLYANKGFKHEKDSTDSGI
ncbi:flagellar FliJ family protein [Helicobacter sp. 11S02629-2]|uniref:flagellar FliJ family protein n=1 Tax=Helicobacter sp. 11S02629-2 TaxID=1476195 RepID=UPI000BA62AD1|nr:flagellar FliJ family protein [Helicobacter sp. 11S02629-2]PAF44971.1 hypothetical protein BKH40_04610 [Helicobacter sp. 11S02629-2]